MIKAVYPGTFDPITRGHEDLVRRAADLFDTVVVGVADSRGKKPFFTLAERIDLARDALAQYTNVKVEGFSGLLRDLSTSRMRGSSCAGCAPCPTSNTSSRWPA
jgi:pantetheine-phosphate adenylyltransferase